MVSENAEGLPKKKFLISRKTDAFFINIYKVSRFTANSCRKQFLPPLSGKNLSTNVTTRVGMLGAYLNIHNNEQTSFPAFINSAFKTISYLDIIASVFKAICYGFTIVVAGCYQGYNAKNGTKGVGNAANVAVVLSMFLIFMGEMIIVQFVIVIR